ncbi:MAG: toprim domain-containing protein [Dehalococcoidia bacterium]|nr:toprim domain-containing protein [Dehalococcoidia bacterium]
MHNTDAIRRSHPIVDVAAASGLRMRQTRGRLVAACPFHGDSKPSLVIYPSTQSYYCFGCGAGGDVLDFVSRLHRVDFKGAAELLEGSGFPTPVSPGLRHAPAPTPAIDPASAVAVVETALAFYEAAIWSQPKVLAYLASRGVASATIRHHRLGFGVRGLVDELRRQSLDLDVAEQLGLLNEGRESFVGRVVIPDLVGGRPTWFTGRRLDEREPRYFNLRLPKPVLGLASARGEAIILTEGPFDWLTAVGWGFTSVGLLGTRGASTSTELLGRFEEVYLVFDNDEAGMQATDEWCERLGDRAIPVTLPPCVVDLNGLGSQANGRQVFTRCVLDAARAARAKRRQAA